MVAPQNSHAHVTANPNNGTSGAYFETKFRVTHGCSGSDVIALKIQIPPELLSVKPQSKAGWDINIQRSKLTTPVPSAHGKVIEERTDSVEWSGSVLPDTQYDEFGLMFKLPEVKHETVLWFKTTQICKNGQIEWHDIPQTLDGWGKMKSPSPYVKVLPVGAKN